VSTDPLAGLAPLLDDPAAGLAEHELKAGCASAYEQPMVRWLLGGELHPGGEQVTRRALELAGVRSGSRLVDVASGSGASALLAARELGCDAIGIDYGEGAVLGATAAAQAEGLDDRVVFVRGDSEALPLPDGCADAVLCECSLCTFPDKAVALAEMRRVLRPGGSVAISDVVADHERLPSSLRGALATIACVGSALPRGGCEAMLGEAGFEVLVAETRNDDAARFTEGIEERLRGARLLGLGSPPGSPFGLQQAIELVGLARRSIDAGALGYSIVAGRAR
jgi:ubiquinone/menaquinone biosynthesis C-methylase UbiE